MDPDPDLDADPNPAIFVSGLQYISKKDIFFPKFILLITL
jgi:hypothetical protein